MVKTEVGEDIWDLDISRWGDVAIMDVGRVVIMGVEGKLAGGEFGMMNANKESFFSLIIPSISVWSSGKSFLKRSWTQLWHENSLDDF